MVVWSRFDHFQMSIFCLPLEFIMRHASVWKSRHLLPWHFSSARMSVLLEENSSVARLQAPRRYLSTAQGPFLQDICDQFIQDLVLSLGTRVASGSTGVLISLKLQSQGSYRLAFRIESKFLPARSVETALR